VIGGCDSVVEVASHGAALPSCCFNDMSILLLEGELGECTSIQCIINSVRCSWGEPHKTQTVSRILLGAWLTMGKCDVFDETGEEKDSCNLCLDSDDGMLSRGCFVLSVYWIICGHLEWVTYTAWLSSLYLWGGKGKKLK
jgi:hypothetical protein